MLELEDYCCTWDEKKANKHKLNNQKVSVIDEEFAVDARQA